MDGWLRRLGTGGEASQPPTPLTGGDPNAPKAKAFADQFKMNYPVLLGLGREEHCPKAGEELVGVVKKGYEDVAAKLTGALDGSGLPWAFLGGLASSIHGRPRWTYDLDVFVGGPGASFGRLLVATDDGRYVDRSVERGAVGGRHRADHGGLAGVKHEWCGQAKVAENRRPSRLPTAQAT